MADTRETRRTIVRLLGAMGSVKEIRQYLKRFSEEGASRFAVVKVGGQVLRDEADDLVSSLSFLQQVGLTPVVIHGAGPQLGDALAAAGVETVVRRGLRVTPAKALSVVAEVFRDENLRLVGRLQAAGVRAASIPTGVFEADFMNRRTLGYVGKVTGIRLGAVTRSLDDDAIPVLASLGETRGGQLLNVNADVAANDFVREFRPYKVIFLTGAGGLLDGDGEVIPSVNLSTDYERLLAEPWLHSGMRLKMEQIHDLLRALPLSSSVAVTAPGQLAKELFTHRGSGTLVRMGERIRRFTSWAKTDVGRLKTLVESAFRRKLVPDYFERTTLYRAYVSEHYRAALVLTKERGVAHLDKFAVSDDAQGEGLGRAAWRAMRADNPALFWRSRPDNPVNEFYAEEADGMMKGPKWTVFWYGLDGFDLIESCVEHCRGRPQSLVG